MNQLDRIAAEWLAARKVIADALREWGTTEVAAEVRAEAIIARLAAHDPPILLEMTPKDMLEDMPTVHQRKCHDCGNVAWHADSRTPYVLCRKCGSQDTRKVK